MDAVSRRRFACHHCGQHEINNAIKMSSSTAPATSSYVYGDLPDAGTTVRLLKLLPGHREEPICIDLFDQDLAAPPRFEALSYTWGDDPGSNKVLCGDLWLPVTSNLHAVLLELRHLDEPRIMWIDAICINQDNRGEKNHQVVLMRKIYSTAERVIVWLGEADAETPILLEFWKQIIQAVYEGLLPWNGKHLHWAADTMNVEHDRLVRIISAFLRRPWFQRVWVVQEFALASDVEMRIGSYTIPADTLKMLRPLDLSQEGLSSQATSGEALSWMKEEISRRGYGRPPWMVAHAARTRQCKDHRDHIYAILGLLEPKMALDITPDYGKSVREVYTAFTATCINVSDTLEVLGFTSLEENGKTNNLPSWVPDWREQTELKRVHGTHKGINNATPNTQFSKFGSIHGEELHLRGNVIDSVDVVCPARLERNAAVLKMKDILDVFHTWATFFFAHCKQRYMISGQPSIEAFVRIITFNSEVAGVLQDGAPSDDALTPELVSALIYSLHLLHEKQAIPGFTDPLPLEKPDLLRFYDYDLILDHISTWTMGRKLFVTKQGYIGLGPNGLWPDDIVFIAYGGKVPLVVRRQDNQFLYVGDSYVQGLMNGECVDFDKAVDLTLI